MKAKSKGFVIAFLRRQHIEMYALIAFPLLYLFTLILVHPDIASLFGREFFESILYYLFFGWSFFLFGLTFTYLYIGLKIIFFFARKFHTFLMEFRVDQFTFPSQSIPIFKSMGYMFMLVAVALSVDIIAAFHILRSDGDHVFRSTEWVMQLDYQVFGTYPAYALHDIFTNPTFQKILIDSYMGLGSALSIVFLGLLMTSKRNLRKFIMLFLLIPMVVYATNVIF